MTTPKLTVETNEAAFQTDSLLSFRHANREVLRITHDGHMICGEGLSVNAATQEAAKLLIASFEERIQEMVDARVAAELVTMNVPRREKAEADTARLDWLEAHALPQHSPNISISDLGRHFNGFPGSFRAAIDAAMKEGSK